MPEFELDGNAFDAVERLVEGVDIDADNGDDDPDAGGVTTDDSDDGDDTDVGSPNRRYTARQKEQTIEAIADDTDESIEEIAETLLIRPEDDDEVAEIVASVRDGDDNTESDAEEPAPLASPERDAPPVTDDVPTRSENGGVDYDPSEIGEPGDVMDGHDEVDAGAKNVDVIAITHDEFGVGVEVAYEPDVRFVTPEGKLLSDIE